MGRDTEAVTPATIDGDQLLVRVMQAQCVRAFAEPGALDCDTPHAVGVVVQVPRAGATSEVRLYEDLSIYMQRWGMLVSNTHTQRDSDIVTDTDTDTVADTERERERPMQRGTPTSKARDMGRTDPSATYA